MHKIYKYQDGGTPPQIKNSGFDLLSILQPPGLSVSQGPKFQTPKPSLFKNLGQSLKSGVSTIVNTGITKAGPIAGMVSQILPDKDKDFNSTDQFLKGARRSGQQMMISSGNPLLAGIGGLDAFIDKIGGHTDATQGAGTFNDIANGVMSFVPGAGFLAGRTEAYSQDDRIKRSSSYTNEVFNGNKVARNAGAKVLFGKGSINDATRAQKQKDVNTKKILTNADDSFLASTYNGFSLGNQIELTGGPKFLRAKQGAKLKQETTTKVDTAKDVVEIVEQFKEGGKVNVIPEGALHKNKHHMESISDNFKDLTTKGIPVVTEDRGELIQQAEIERNEIIFNLDVTKKLESLMENGSDEAAIKAGKLLAVEIIENTIDNTGLIQEIL